MIYLLAKAFLTGVIVVVVSELAKRSSILASLVVSLPLTSILAMVWLYSETQDLSAVSKLSTGIFWMVLPSLFFFVAFLLATRSGLRFYPALASSCASMAVVYWIYVRVLEWSGIKI